MTGNNNYILDQHRLIPHCDIIFGRNDRYNTVIKSDKYEYQIRYNIDQAMSYIPSLLLLNANKCPLRYIMLVQTIHYLTNIRSH